MKRSLKKYSLILAVAGIMLLAFSCDKKSDTKSHQEHNDHTSAKVYTCPMHPEIIRNAPGSCPICKMDLVEKMAVSSEQGLALGVIVEPVNQTVIMNTKTITPVKESRESLINAKGYITYNPKNISSVASRYSGRIDKLYVKYNFQEVKKGQKLMDIYSPELLTAQENYIFILNSKEDDQSIVNAAKQRLILLGMTETQIRQIENSRKAEYLVSIYAPISGHIHQMENLNELTMPTMSMGGNSGGMNNGTPNEVSTIREGNYVEKGESVFSIISLSDVWVILKIYPEDIGQVKIGQSVEIASEIAPDNPINAKISYIEPVLDKDSKFISVRVYLENCDHHVFKIGSMTNGIIHTGKQSGLWIPANATLSLGNGTSVVFKKEGNAFKTHAIKLGARENKNINILEGLTEKDTIAANAWYMIDSESFVVTK